MTQTQWEHRWVELHSHARKLRTEASVTPPYQLDDLGKDGWEAVSMIPFPGTQVDDDGAGRLLVLMKRPVRGERVETTLRARGAVT